MGRQINLLHLLLKATHHSQTCTRLVILLTLKAPGVVKLIEYHIATKNNGSERVGRQIKSLNFLHLLLKATHHSQVHDWCSY